MDRSTFVLQVLLAVLFVYAAIIYNNLVGLKHGVVKAGSNIDVLLKQRHDELPKLVEAANVIWRTSKAPWKRCCGHVALWFLLACCSTCRRWVWRRLSCVWVSASCSPLPRLIPSSRPATRSNTSRRASPAWRTPSP